LRDPERKDKGHEIEMTTKKKGRETKGRKQTPIEIPDLARGG